CKDQVEALEVPRFDLTRTQTANLDTKTTRHGDGARIRRLPDVLGVRAGRIKANRWLRIRGVESASRDAFCQWRTANVAHANEQHGGWLCPVWHRAYSRRSSRFTTIRSFTQQDLHALTISLGIHPSRPVAIV